MNIWSSNVNAGRNSRHDYDAKYPKDPLGEEMFPNARIWQIYNDETEIWDAEMYQKWKDTTDVLLVFTGLFSAVVTTFLVQSSQGLQDYSSTSSQLLLEMIAIQRAIATGNASSVSAIPSVATPQPDSGSELWINGLWLASLLASLASALITLLVKQWLQNYISVVSGSSRDQALTRQYRFDALQMWKVEEIIAMLPFLLHISLFLFFAGLAVYFRILYPPLFSLILCIGGTTLAFYVITNLLPALNSSCSYVTPLSRYFHLLCQQIRLIRVFRPLNSNSDHAESYSARSGFKNLKALESHVVDKERDSFVANAVIWLYTATANARVKEACILAQAGIPAHLNGFQFVRGGFDYGNMINSSNINSLIADHRTEEVEQLLAYKIRFGYLDGVADDLVRSQLKSVQHSMSTRPLFEDSPVVQAFSTSKKVRHWYTDEVNALSYLITMKGRYLPLVLWIPILSIPLSKNYFQSSRSLRVPLLEFAQSLSQLLVCAAPAFVHSNSRTSTTGLIDWTKRAKWDHPSCTFIELCNELPRIKFLFLQLVHQLLKPYETPEEWETVPFNSGFEPVVSPHDLEKVSICFLELIRRAARIYHKYPPPYEGFFQPSVAAEILIITLLNNAKQWQMRFGSQAFDIWSQCFISISGHGAVERFGSPLDVHSAVLRAIRSQSDQSIRVKPFFVQKYCQPFLLMFFIQLLEDCSSADSTFPQDNVNDVGGLFHIIAEISSLSTKFLHNDIPLTEICQEKHWLEFPSKLEMLSRLLVAIYDMRTVNVINHAHWAEPERYTAAYAHARNIVTNVTEWLDYPAKKFPAEWIDFAGCMDQCRARVFNDVILLKSMCQFLSHEQSKTSALDNLLYTADMETGSISSDVYLESEANKAVKRIMRRSGRASAIMRIVVDELHNASLKLPSRRHQKIAIRQSEAVKTIYEDVVWLRRTLGFRDDNPDYQLFTSEGGVKSDAYVTVKRPYVPLTPEPEIEESERPVSHELYVPASKPDVNATIPAPPPLLSQTSSSGWVRAKQKLQPFLAFSGLTDRHRNGILPDVEMTAQSAENDSDRTPQY